MNKVLSCLAIALVAVGCTQPPPYVPSVNTIIVPGGANCESKHAAYRLEVLDDVLTNCLPVVGAVRAKTNDGFNRAEVKFKNMSTAPLRIRYRFEWLDDKGSWRTDPGQDSWEKTTFASGDVKSLSSIEPRNDCTDCKLQVKCIVEN